MKKFVVIYRAPASSFDKMKDMTPEDHKKGMEPWMVWMKKCGSGLVDGGAPLKNGKNINPDGISESDSDIAGYSILQAENMEKAVIMLKNHPHLKWDAGCSIELYECMAM